ncbi:MAG: hypothetical protein KDC98_06805 [Planctomycetes bacterium]|nr:hypothetical protein [Planctomycetota bacterium]
MRSLLCLGTLFVVVCGALAGWITGGVVPAAIRDGKIELRQVPYAARWDDEPFVIDPTHRLDVPWAYADFDLQMDVELGEGATLDLLMRRVEPRFVDEYLEPFHGRFSALRLSADRGGEPWFSRDRLLLGDHDAAGAELASGYTATVWVKGRGRRLEANVAGKPLPGFLAADNFGSFLFAARGGTAVLKGISITSRGQPRAWLWSRWLWLGLGALAGLVVRALGLVIGLSAFKSGVFFAFGAWIVARAFGPLVLPLSHPAPGTLMAMLASAGCITGLLSERYRIKLPAAALAFGLLYLAPSFARDDRALDAIFGPKAGSALAEAHAQLVRGPLEIHDVRAAERRVFLLGGEQVYGMTEDTLHLEPLLKGDLRVAKQQRVDVPCLSTPDGHAAQQWELFSRFYTEYRPQVIVLGIGPYEGDPDPATGVPRSYPSDVERTIAKAREYCAGHAAHLVLFAAKGVAADFLAVLEKEAGRGTPLVIAGDDDHPTLSRRLADVIAPLLP